MSKSQCPLMTDRLYYTDAYLATFTARVVDRADDGRRIYLDRSALYPTSGGQPHDHGRIDGIAVVDVVDEDDRVAHVLTEPLAPTSAEVQGTVNWFRRFDFMQQHTGQHLLSALLHDHFGWPTVSVHFGEDSATLDVTAGNVDAGQLREAEQLANVIVTENRDVTVSFEDSATATGLRKPSDRSGPLRIVSIHGLDRSACGGTHVRRTGEIGALLLRRSERMKGTVRIEFLCGQRAIARSRREWEALSRAALALTAAPDEVPSLVEAQALELRDLERERRRLEGEVAEHTARALWSEQAPGDDGVRRIHVSRETGAVKDSETLAQAIVSQGHALVVVTSASPLGVMFAVSDDVDIDAGMALKAAVSVVGGRGGGSRRLAQGSVPTAEALQAVRRALGGTP
jgi:alanyl-tRNA synthetase